MNSKFKNSIKKIYAICISCLLVAIFLSSCTSKEETSSSEMFTARDMDITYDESSAVEINLKDDASSSDSENVNIDGNTITITEEGTYIISGSLSNGQVVVDSENTDKLQIVLSDASINCDTSAAIYVKQADKVFLTTGENSENSLSTDGEFVLTDENSVDAVIFSKDDLTLNGAGTLSIETSYGHGVVSKDDLVLTSGTYNIKSSSHGLSGNDSVRIADGDITIVGGNDGIHSENTDDATLGFVYIQDGTFDITSTADGISSTSYLEIKDGTFEITSGKNSSATSMKGLKSTGDLTISGGKINITSVDDSLHSEGNVNISDGSLVLSSEDDGIHANTNVTVSGGSVSVEKSYEGIEGQNIDIKGGSVSVVSSDDGFNAAGGNDGSGTGGNMNQDAFAVSEDSYIKIHDGVINVDASGDGLDSNGHLYIYGGETYVSGPTNDGNGALDYNGDGEITGGIIIATGSSGMAQNFGTSSTQGSLLTTVTSSSSGKVSLKDSSGDELVSFTPSKSFSSVLVSCPELTKGSSYTLTVGGTSTSITMTSLIYGSGGNGMGGGQDKMRP